MQEKEENKQNQMEKETLKKRKKKKEEEEEEEEGKIREKETWNKKREHSEHFIPKSRLQLTVYSSILSHCSWSHIIFCLLSFVQQASKRYLEQRDPAF